MKFIIFVVILITMFSCSKLSSTRNALKAITGKDSLEVKDLSKLPTDELIKTKYNKLQFICDYTINAEQVNDGANNSQSKTAQVVWDIISKTVFTKEILHIDQVLNLNFSYNLNLALSVDSSFNSHINLKTKYVVKTLSNSGAVLTQMESDGTNASVDLDENEKINIIELSSGPTSASGLNKIKMDCSLVSDVKPEYK